MSSAHNFEDRAVELFTSWSKRRTYFRAFHGHIVSQGWTSEFHTSPRRTVAAPQKHPIVPKGYQSFTILRHHCLPLPMGVKDAISDIYWNYLWDQIFPTIHFASNTTNDSFLEYFGSHCNASNLQLAPTWLRTIVAHMAMTCQCTWWFNVGDTAVHLRIVASTVQWFWSVANSADFKEYPRYYDMSWFMIHIPVTYHLFCGVSLNGGFSTQIIHFLEVFHYFHHPFWGIP